MSESITYIALDDLSKALDKVSNSVPAFAEAVSKAFWTGDPTAELLIECRTGNTFIHICIHRDTKDMTRYVFHNVIREAEPKKTSPNTNVDTVNQNPDNWGPWDEEYYIGT